MPACQAIGGARCRWGPATIKRQFDFEVAMEAWVGPLSQNYGVTSLPILRLTEIEYMSGPWGDFRQSALCGGRLQSRPRRRIVFG